MHERSAPRDLFGLTRSDKAIAIVLASVSLSMSVLMTEGVVSSNDGAHYALVRALYDDGTTVIDRHIKYTEWMDYSSRDGSLYSDRPPGTAFLALPFYGVAHAARLNDHGRQIAAGLTSIFFGAGAVVLTFLLAMQLGVSRTGAAIGALTLALCTTHRSYSTGLWNHAISAFFIVALLLACLRVLARHERGADRLVKFGLGVLAAFAVTVDYTAAVVGAVAMSATVLMLWGRRSQRSLTDLVRLSSPVLLGLGLGLVPLLVYHYVAFGSAFATGYQFHVLHPSTRSLSALYGGDFSEGLYGLLIDRKGGLIRYSPILLVAILATPWWARTIGVFRTLLVVVPWVGLLLLTSTHSTWHGGYARDARYLSMVIPLICLPLGFVWDETQRRMKHFHTGSDRTMSRLWVSVCGLLFSASVGIQMLKHNFQWVRRDHMTMTELKTAVAADPLGTLHGLLAWLAPHPVAALVVLLAGIGLALVVLRGDRGVIATVPVRV